MKMMLRNCVRRSQVGNPVRARRSSFAKLPVMPVPLREGGAGDSPVGTGGWGATKTASTVKEKFLC
jgi:hypothetical protein